MDSKADRKNEELIVKNLVLDEHIKVDDQLVSALVDGITSFASSNNCKSIRYERCQPETLKQQLKAAGN
jgi:uncharacterized protein YcaQ